MNSEKLRSALEKFHRFFNTELDEDERSIIYNLAALTRSPDLWADMAPPNETWLCVRRYMTLRIRRLLYGQWTAAEADPYLWRLPDAALRELKEAVRLMPAHYRSHAHVTSKMFVEAGLWPEEELLPEK